MWPTLGTLSCFRYKSIQNNLKHNNYKQSTEPCQCQQKKVHITSLQVHTFVLSPSIFGQSLDMLLEGRFSYQLM